jgi:hypothetical protein
MTDSPEVRFWEVKGQLPIDCWQGRFRNATKLVRLVFSDVLHYGPALHSAMFDPQCSQLLG